MKRLFSRRYFPDPRDQKYRLRKVRTERVSRNWKDGWWENADQKDEPACCGFAAVGWLAAQPLYQWMDPLGVYRLATLIDEWPEDTWENSEGTSVRAVMKILQQLGFISEYRWGYTVKNLLPHLLEYSPIVLGTNWYESMCEPDRVGRITVSGDVLGGHAYLWSGVNLRTGLARIKNSWGDSWGQEGHAYITLDDLDRLISENGEACAGIERKPRSK